MTPEIVYPSDVDQTKQLLASYAYTFHGDSCQIRQKAIAYPVVASGQNGSGTADSQQEVDDEYGQLTWIKDECRLLTRQQFDQATGALRARLA